MILCGLNSVGYVSLSTVVRTTADVPVAADANAVDAAFYRVDPASGNITLDLNVGTAGHITMTAVPGVTGMYVAPVQLSTLLFKQYHVVITYQVSGASRTALEEIMVLTELDVLSANAESLSGGVALAMHAPVVP